MKHNETKSKVNSNKNPYLCASFKDATYCTKGNRTVQVNREHSILLPLLYGLTNSIEIPFSLTGDEAIKPLTEKQMKHMTPEKIKKLMRCTPKVCEDIRELDGVFLDINTANYKTVIAYDGMYWTQKIFKKELGSSKGVLLAESTGDTLTIYDGEDAETPFLKLDTDFIEDLDLDLEEHYITDEVMHATAYLKELKDDGCYYDTAAFFYGQLAQGRFGEMISYFDEFLRGYVEEFVDFMDTIVPATVSSGNINCPEFFLDLSEEIAEVLHEASVSSNSVSFYTLRE